MTKIHDIFKWEGYYHLAMKPEDKASRIQKKEDLNPYINIKTTIKSQTKQEVAMVSLTITISQTKEAH